MSNEDEEKKWKHIKKEKSFSYFPRSSSDGVCRSFDIRHRTQKEKLLYITESIIRYQNFSRYFFHLFYVLSQRINKRRKRKRNKINALLGEHSAVTSKLKVLHRFFSVSNVLHRILKPSYPLEKRRERKLRKEILPSQASDNPIKVYYLRSGVLRYIERRRVWWCRWEKAAKNRLKREIKARRGKFSSSHFCQSSLLVFPAEQAEG